MQVAFDIAVVIWLIWLTAHNVYYNAYFKAKIKHLWRELQ